MERDGDNEQEKNKAEESKRKKHQPYASGSCRKGWNIPNKLSAIRKWQACAPVRNHETDSESIKQHSGRAVLRKEQGHVINSSNNWSGTCNYRIYPHIQKEK